MTIIDYFLLGVVAAAAIFTAYRLFRGWRNSALTRDQTEEVGEPSAPPETVRGSRLATGTPWDQRAKEQLKASNFEAESRY